LTAALNTNILIPGPGGRGGDGARGGTGGRGGTGNAGRKGLKQPVDFFCKGDIPGNGGSGGDGGQGGAGSGSAGGNGGPSFGIALVSSPQLDSAGLTIYAAQPGEGGAKGFGGQNDNSQCKAPDGEAGRKGFSDDTNSIVSFNSARRREDDEQ
jgi:hypothetical protein